MSAVFGSYVSAIPGASLIPGLASLTEDFIISLGSMQLENFEEPSSIKGGTTQAVGLHRYPGGVRTIDTYGADPKNPVFSGRMMGPDAEQRVQMLDIIVQQGLAVNFSYSQKTMQVVLIDLDWDFLNFYDVTYTLTIEVITDYGLTNPASIITDLDNTIHADISWMSKSISGLVGGLF